MEYNFGEVYACGTLSDQEKTLSDPAGGNCFEWGLLWAAAWWQRARKYTLMMERLGNWAFR